MAKFEAYYLNISSCIQSSYFSKEWKTRKFHHYDHQWPRYLPSRPFLKKNCCKKMHLKVSFEWISFLFYWAMREKLDLVLVFKTSVKNFPLIYICLKCSTAYNFDITLTKVERYSKIVKKKFKKIHGFSFDL